jgi:hypothetical protein
LVGIWRPYPVVEQSTLIGTSTPWNPPAKKSGAKPPNDANPLVGGVARLQFSATLPGVLDNPIQSEPRWIDVPGTNPQANAVNTLVANKKPTDADVIEHIFCYESGSSGLTYYNQFSSAADTREPKTSGVPSDWTPNPGTLRPLFGADPAGIGIAQRDPAPFPTQQWDWKLNVLGGIGVFGGGLDAATNLQTREQSRLDNERNMALDAVNPARRAKGLPPVQIAREIVPPDPDVMADAISRYNTGAGNNLYFFDYHYLASQNNMQVLTNGTGTWVTDDGQWQTKKDWKAAGGVHVARSWIQNHSYNEAYVSRVKNCTVPQ